MSTGALKKVIIKKFYKIHWKMLVFLHKVIDLQAVTLSKKILQHSCFPVTDMNVLEQHFAEYFTAIASRKYHEIARVTANILRSSQVDKNCKKCLCKIMKDRSKMVKLKINLQ